MPESDLRVYVPHTVSELTGLLRRYPEARIYSGGTAISHTDRPGILDLPPVLVALYGVEDLRRIARTDQYLDIGANATIRAISRVGHNVVPQILTDTLPHIVPPGLRNLATLVGNVCVPGRTMTSVPTLMALGASVELRRSGGGRWLTLARFHGDKNGPAIGKGEVVTRLRVPLERHDVQFFRKTEDTRLTFAAVASGNKGTLEEVRMVIGSAGHSVMRNRELEAELTGRKLPLGKREIASAAERMRVAARSSELSHTSFDLYRIAGFVSGFLHKLGRT
ncbi:MAG: FAD binding domain-containing protein [bacterium]